jgi:hypothetical protein
VSTVKALGLAIAFAASFAFAHEGNPAANAAASSGSGMDQSSQKTGSAAHSPKVVHNQNRNSGSSRAPYHVSRAVYSYYRNGKHCEIVHRLRGPRMRICH